MSKLERELTPSIPFEAAASFYLKLKTAGWTDPPDVTGALEGAFNVPKEQVLDKLKHVIAAKARLMLAWYTYAQSFKGDAWRAIKDEFQSHAEDEQEGFNFYAKRAAALGGPIHMDDIEAPPAASDPQAIFQIMARAEQEGILAQRELRQLVGDENPMKIGIEEHLALDQHHLDEMWQMMPQAAQAALQGMDPNALGAESAAAAPVEEAVEPAVEEASAVPAAPSPAAKEAAARFKAAVKLAGVADVAPAFGGLSAGYGMGGNAADATARALAPSSQDNKAGKAARRAAMVAAPLAGLGAMVAAHKLHAVPHAMGALKRLSPLGTIAAPEIEQEIARLVVPAGAALGGSLLGGAAAGGVIGGARRGDHVEGHAKAAALQRVLRKVAFTPGEAQPQPMEATPQPPAAVGYDQQPQEEPAPATPAEGVDLEAANYLNAEQIGRQAQEANESAFYRERFQQAQQQMAQLQAQAQEAQASTDQLQQQQAMINQDVSQRTNEALEANVEATRQAQAAANLRIGLEKMRQQLLGVVSQDPELLAQTPSMDPAMGGQLGDPGMEAPPEEGGPADQAAPAQGQPGEAPAGAGVTEGTGAEPPNASGGSGTVVNVSASPTEKKEAGIRADVATYAPWALGGAAIGAGLGMIPQKAHAAKLRDQIQTQSAARAPGDFEAAKALSKQYSQLHEAEQSSSSPGRGALAGALAGGMALGSAGPAIMQHIKDIKTFGFTR